MVSLSCSAASQVRAQQAPDHLFQIEGYSDCIVSSSTFPLNVYVLSLPDVGNYRLLNHTAVVEGTLAAIHDEFDALRKLDAKRNDDYESGGAFRAIERPTNEGRIRGLDRAQAIYQLGLMAYGDGNYKLSELYAESAEMIANNSMTPISEAVIIVGFIIAVPVAVGLLLLYKFSVLRKKDRILMGTRIKWWLQFLTFTEPEQQHRVMRLENLGSTEFSLLTAAVWLLGPFMVVMGTLISYNINPAFTVTGLLVSIFVGVLAWLEFLHILYDRPTKQKSLPQMTARYNASLNIYVCPKCLFPLDGNGGTCKVCGVRVDPAEQ